ncbi:MAG: hypothetical protein ACRENE_09375 [Polyangiaceae bacterium]
MSTRRQFLRQATVTLVLIPVGAACSSVNGSTPLYGGGAPAPACDGVSSTSSVTANHQHTVCVLASDLTNPPSSGATYATSQVVDPVNNVTHDHLVAFTAAQLRMIEANQSVTVTTSVAEDHTHQFAVQKM